MNKIIEFNRYFFTDKIFFIIIIFFLIFETNKFFLNTIDIIRAVARLLGLSNFKKQKFEIHIRCQ